MCACSKDDETPTAPADGQYIADTPNLVAAIYIKDGRCTYFAPFIQGAVVSSWRDLSTSGSYPDYVYSGGDVTITAKFETKTAFSATLDGRVSTDAPITFRRDNNRVLDVNGDGILDSAQPEIK